MWQDLGFKDSPYDVRPLRAIKEDADLLVGRSDQSVALCTALEAAKEGVLVLSRKPGVGETSFLNVQQYLLSESLTPFGPKVLPAYYLCPIQADDTPRVIALRALENYTKSIENYCQLKNIKPPKEITEITKWVKANQTGLKFHIDPARKPMSCLALRGLWVLGF